MKLARALVALALLTLAGCESSGSQFVFDVQVIDASGQNPIAGLGATTARFYVQQGDGDPIVYSEAVIDDSFDARIVIDPNIAPTYAAVEFLDDAGVVLMHGAAPPFDPAETALAGYYLYLVVGAPSSCDILAGETLTSPRVGFAVADAHTFGFLIGGEESASASDKVENVDLLLLSVDDFSDDLSMPAGPAEAVNISTIVSLVVSRDAVPFTYDPSEAAPIRPVTLHTGASDLSALAERGAAGAVVAGGESMGSPVSDVSWVAADLGLMSTDLSTARSAAAAAASGDTVLVAGGMVADAAVVEQIAPGSPTGTPIPGSDTLGEWNDPHIFVDEAGAQALVVGGTDAMGSARADTLLITGCPASCAAQPGPAWANPRVGTSALLGENVIVGGSVMGVPSAAVDQVSFGVGSAAITSAATLDVAREAPGLFSLGGGSYLVLAGRGALADRDDVEVCFPAALTR